MRVLKLKYLCTSYYVIVKMILSVENISKKYGKQQAVSRLSFSVEKGEIVGFLGPNGAGKSTTMKMIAGCLMPDGGEILIGGKSVITYPLEAKKMIGYLPEDNPLYEEMYVREYLEYVAGLYGFSRDAREKSGEIIDAVSLSPEAHKKIGQLSKGYRQRVGLAQAFIHNPELLILDEPITGLDPNQIDEIRDFLIRQSQDKAILFSSHTLPEVSSVCTRVIIICAGKIVFDKPMTEVDDLATIFKDLTSKD